LVYSTYLGGVQGSDRANAIAVDAAGNAYIAGKTTSTDFPVTAGAVQNTLKGFQDAFIAKLNPGGTALVYSTYLGGSLSDEAFGIAVDAAGRTYLAGHTGSTDFPTTMGSLQRSFGGGNEFGGDAFVVRLDQSGSNLLYATYLGGEAADVGRAIAIDSA